MSEAPRIALVTGASSGIGAAIADRLCSAGYHVVGTSTSPEGAERITQALRQHHENAWGYALDVTDAEQIDACFRFAEETAGGTPSVLINNAGITRDNLLMRMTPEDWWDVIDTNLTAQYHLCRKAVRSMMKARHGRIINIGSVVATSGNPGQTNYCAAKAGLEGFSKALALEVASRGITVNVVAPGFIRTRMTDKLTDEQKSGILQKIPAGRMGEATEIADAVKFLASDEAGYITGHTLHVNGGMEMV